MLIFLPQRRRAFDILLYFLIQLQLATGILRHIQVFFRHGERTPTSFLSFPTEQSPSADLIDELELGELTQRGKWQEYRLGQWLGHEYGQWIGSRYRPRELNVYSGRDNRTMTSAELVLAGMLPPQGDQLWNRALPWQPIPVETVPMLDHPSFGMFDHCPAEKLRIQASPGYARLSERFAAEMETLSVQTGLNISDLSVFQKVLDALVTRAELPKLLPLPAWARQPGYVDGTRKSRLALHEGLIDLFLDNMGGWHLDQLIGRMDDAVHNRSSQKTVLYSAHDTNFLTMGRYMGISRIADIFPDYASLLAFELHEEADEDFHVKLKFRMGLNDTVEQLEIADCPSPCPLGRFRSLRSRVTTAQWMSLCQQRFPVTPFTDDQCTFYGSIAGALTVLVVLLLGSLLSLLLTCRSYKQRYEHLAAAVEEADEKSPLLISSRSAAVRRRNAGPAAAEEQMSG